MVNNVNNSGIQGNNAAAYQTNKQQLEQVKQDTVVRNQVDNNAVKGAEKDSVALTPQAKQLKELNKKVSEIEGFDKQKVEEIKKAIAEGEYKVNYERLASKLAAFEFEL